MTLRTVLALADPADFSGMVVDRAALLAAQHGAELRVMLCGWGPPPPPAEGLPRLQRQARRLSRQPGTPVTVLAQPARRLADVAREAAACDLVVAPHRPRPGWPLPLGRRSLGEVLATRLGRPTLTVKSMPYGPYARVLVPVDLRPRPARGPGPDQPVHLAGAVAAPAPVHLLNVVRGHRPAWRRLSAWPARRGAQADAADRARRLEALAQLAAPLATQGRRASADLADGEAVADTIVAQQIERRVDLVVLGAASGAGWFDRLTGGTVGLVSQAAACDVLIVPPAAG